MASDLDVEYATVGGVLLCPAQLPRVSEWLRPADFARPPARTVYQLALLVQARGDPVDPVTMLAELRRRGELRRDGYPAHDMLRMVEAVPAAASTTYYARIVLGQSIARQVREVGQRLVQFGEGGREPGELFKLTGEQFGKLADARRRWALANGEPTPRSASREPAVLRDVLADVRLPARRNGLVS